MFLIMAAAPLRQLHLVRSFLMITLITVVAMRVAGKATRVWGLILSIVGFGSIRFSNILPLEGRRRLAET